MQAAGTARPAIGCTPVDSAVTITGPATKMHSSTTDSKENAVCSRAGFSRSAYVQRARTQAPSDTWVSPAAAAAGNSVQIGSPASATAMNTAKLAALASTTGTSTRRCP